MLTPINDAGHESGDHGRRGAIQARRFRARPRLGRRPTSANASNKRGENGHGHGRRAKLATDDPEQP